MNAAEKARLAREKQEDAKRKKKIRFWAKVIKTVEILFILATIGILIAVTAMLEVKNMEALAVCYRVGVGVLIADVIGVFACFVIMTKERDVTKSEHLAGIASFLTCAILLLAFILFFGALPMLKD